MIISEEPIVREMGNRHLTVAALYLERGRLIHLGIPFFR